MSHTLHINEEAQLRQVIISQCTWSETYSSLKHILKRTANQLPLLVSFGDDNDERGAAASDIIDQTVFFFDRNVSNKILLTPLQQLEDRPEQFEVNPRHCTFAITDLFKGVFEFVRDGKRCSRIHTDLKQLVDFATKMKCAVLFMSRDCIQAYYSDSKSSHWSSKEYPQGAIFQAQRIHRSSSNNQGSNSDYLECLDEDGYAVFLKMNHSGRYSLIITSIDQIDSQQEIFLHSTQTPNIGQLIKRLTLDNNTNNNNCIRLVRGAVPHNFHCQYLQLVRQHTYDILAGLTEEGLVVEWNLESHVPCRYATNLNEVLNKLSGTWEEQILESYIDQTRTHYRENFQFNMQLMSTKDWGAIFQYWKWTGDLGKQDKDDKKISYQSRHRFHLVASIQDLSDNCETLSSAFKESTSHHHDDSQSFNEIPDKRGKKMITPKQRLFLSHMSKILSSSTSQKTNRISSTNPRATSLIIPTTETLFDNSVYDSNQNRQPKHNSRRTQ